jgi:hypothetical protein
MPAIKLPKSAIQSLLFLRQLPGQGENKFIVKRPNVIYRHRINSADFHLPPSQCFSSEEEFFGRFWRRLAASMTQASPK